MTIGTIENYYGCLHVVSTPTGYKWSIEDWQDTQWEEIPEYLAHALMKFERERSKAGREKKGLLNEY